MGPAEGFLLIAGRFPDFHRVACFMQQPTTSALPRFQTPSRNFSGIGASFTVPHRDGRLRSKVFSRLFANGLECIRALSSPTVPTGLQKGYLCGRTQSLVFTSID